MRIRVFLKAYDSTFLSSTCKNLQKILIAKKCKITGAVSLPLRRKNFCVLRSPHIDNNSREHFEIRVSKVIFDINFTSIELIDFLLSIELPSGIYFSIKFI